MIRWRYILPRLAVVATAILALRYLISPVMGYVTAQSLHRATGVQVQSGEAQLGLFPLRLQYNDVQVQWPRHGKTGRGDTTAQSVELSVDGGALMRRRYVVRDAHINGLNLNVTDLGSGQLQLPEQPPGAVPSAAMRWLAGLFHLVTDAGKEQAGAVAASSESLRRGDQVRRRWKGEYALLARRSEELEAAIEQMQQTATGVENPLRDWRRLDVTLSKAKSIQQELALVRKSLDEMAAEFQADLVTMERARQADLQRASEALPLDLAASDTLGSGLLLPTVKAQIDHVRGYLDFIRELSQCRVDHPQGQRHRGEIIDLTPKTQLPTVLVRRCEISGLLSGDGHTYQMTGILENLTPQAKLRDQPLRARLRLQGEQTIRMQYVRDDSAAVPHESLTMHWPEVDGRVLRLQSADSLDLEIRGGRLELWVQLDSHGDQMTGRLVSRRVDTNVGLQAPEQVTATAMFASLQRSLAVVDRIEIDAEFKGHADDLEVTLSTNLSGVLKSGVREATAGHIAATRAAMQAEIDQLYAAQLTELQQWWVAQRTQTNEALAKADDKVQEISRKVLSETGSADTYIGRLRSNANNLQ